MSEKLYGWLLKLYPARFTAEYGASMRQVFRDRLRAERGLIGRLRLWLDVLRDLVVSVPLEHRRPPAIVRQPGAYYLSEEMVQNLVRGAHMGPASAIYASILFGVITGLLGGAPHWAMWLVYGCFALFGLTPVFSRRSLRDHWRTYQLIINDDEVRQMAGGRVMFSLQRNEITQLAETPDLGMAIMAGEDRGIWVPQYLGGYTEVRERLSQWLPISPLLREHHSRRWLGRHALGIWFCSLYVNTLMVRTPYVLFPMAALAGIFLVWFLFQTVQHLRRHREAVPIAAVAIPAVLIAVLVARLLFF